MSFWVTGSTPGLLIVQNAETIFLSESFITDFGLPVTTMGSEESYNPYHLLSEVPNATRWPQDNIPKMISTRVIASSSITQKRRAWMLLVVPIMFLLVIAALLCSMLLWLIYSRVRFDSSLASVTNQALIVDEAAQWCQLMAIANHASCDTNHAPSLFGLTLSGILSKVISFSVTYVMAMAILCAGSSWLKATSARETRRMPTPLQYALLITMASGTFSSAWEGWCYLIWRQNRRSKAPFFVKSIFASLVMLLFLSSVVDVADTWLHFYTTTVSLTSTYSPADHLALQPSVAFNTTQCENATIANTCISVEQVTQSGNTMTWVGTTVVRDVGNAVATNSSDAFQVLTFGSTGSDLTAVIVPKINNIPRGMSFRSVSYGMGATCKPAACDMEQWSQTGSTQCTVDGSVLTNHTLNLSATDTDLAVGSSFVPYNLQGSQSNVSELVKPGSNPTNPFGFAQMMGWADEVTDGSDYLIDANKLPIDVIWFMGVCNVSVYDVELSYSNGTYELSNRTLSADNTTTMLFLPFVDDYFSSSFVPLLIPNLVSQVSNNNTDFLTEVARQVSQLGIGLNAGLFEPDQTVSDIKMQKAFLASRYPINALSMLWASTALYLILGVGLLVSAASEKGDVLLVESVTPSSTSDLHAYSSSTTSTLVLAQQRITSPSAIIAEHFILSTSSGIQSSLLAPTLSVQKDAMAMFGDEKGEERLCMGFQSELSPRINEGLRKRVFCVGYQDHLATGE